MVQLTRPLLQYVSDVSLREPDALKKLREVTERHPHGSWATGPVQTQLLALIAHMIGARCILEIGTFTGYTSLALALTLPKEGRLITLDLEESYPAVGRPFWKEAGVDERIEVRIGEALTSMESLLDTPGPGTFDMVYIDCNKKDYDAYYEHALMLVRTGGVVCFDNVLWGGSVADPSDHEKSTMALRSLNQKLHIDTRVMISLLPIGDGLTIAWKRP